MKYNYSRLSTTDNDDDIEMNKISEDNNSDDDIETGPRELTQSDLND